MEAEVKVRGSGSVDPWKHLPGKMFKTNRLRNVIAFRVVI
jgi:hypothetical protein